MPVWLRAHLRYLSYVLRHKREVWKAGRKLRVSPWRLLIHDWSKFLPCEWSPYVAYFYGGTKTIDVQRAFDIAWLHHQHHQDHHWQHWVLTNDSGLIVVLPMPAACRREMLADWMGAGAALGKSDTPGWYRKNREIIQLHIDTRQWVEERLFYGLTMAEFDRRLTSGG